MPETVNVTLPPGARVVSELIEPVPLAALQVLPAVAAQVQVGLNKMPGSGSETVAPTAVEGPAFLATMVYVIEVPGMTSVRLFVLVIDKSPVGTSVSTSAEVLFSGVGSGIPAGGVIVAVFVSVPTAVGAMFAVSE